MFRLQLSSLGLVPEQGYQKCMIFYYRYSNVNQDTLNISQQSQCNLTAPCGDYSLKFTMKTADSDRCVCWRWIFCTVLLIVAMIERYTPSYCFTSLISWRTISNWYPYSKSNGMDFLSTIFFSLY